MKIFRTCALSLLSVVAGACEMTRPLGDLESGAGAGGDATETGGSGGSATGGDANGGAMNGGATNGGATNGGATTGGSANGGSATGGSAMGGSATGGSGGDVGCFSPDETPALALLAGAVGCPCSEAVDQCIAVTEDAGLHLIGMVCSEGRWHSVEDGPCLPGPDPACMIDNRVFYSQQFVPNEFLCDFCSHCEYDYPVCALVDCAQPDPCPADTTQGSRCRSCGLRPGGCDIVEHGCFAPCEDGTPCEFGTCRDGVCSVGPCI